MIPIKTTLINPDLIVSLAICWGCFTPNDLIVSITTTPNANEAKASIVL